MQDIAPPQRCKPDRPSNFSMDSLTVAYGRFRLRPRAFSLPGPIMHSTRLQRLPSVEPPLILLRRGELHHKGPRPEASKAANAALAVVWRASGLGTWECRVAALGGPFW